MKLEVCLSKYIVRCSVEGSSTHCLVDHRFTCKSFGSLKHLAFPMLVTGQYYYYVTLLSYSALFVGRYTFVRRCINFIHVFFIV